MEYPLVSIIIVTYNSSLYVEETLNSAFRQTYPNLEIIITDDCSTDDTVTKCQRWISLQRDFIIPVTLVEGEQNTGISGNCNRGLTASKGSWVKFIAGDDILAPDAIENYMLFIHSHSDVRHLIAKSVFFTGKLDESVINKDVPLSQYLYRDEFTVKQQYAVITKTFFGSGPTYFIQAKALREVGGFDERFPMQEDYPLFIKMIGNGYKMHCLDKVTVFYRVTEGSVQHKREKDAIFTKNHIRMIQEYKFLYQRERLNILWRAFLSYSLCIKNCIINAGNTFKSLSCRLLWILYKTTDPFIWYARYIQSKNNHFLKTGNK